MNAWACKFARPGVFSFESDGEKVQKSPLKGSKFRHLAQFLQKERLA